MNNKKSAFLEYTYYCLFIETIVGICSFNLKYCFYTFIILLSGFVYISVTFRKRAKDKIIYDKTETEVVAFLQKKDINFSKEDFYIFVKNIVYAYNEALMGENLYNIKKITSSQLSHSILTLVENDRRSSIIRIITDINIKGLVLKNYYVKDKREYVEVLVDYKKNQYILENNASREIGDSNKELYVYVFSRMIGSKSQEISFQKNCPGCGANNSNFVVGVCVRCGYMIGNYGDFILERVDDFSEK